MRQGLAASDETGPGFAGPNSFRPPGLAGTRPRGSGGRDTAGKSLLAKGAVGHNHFSFPRYAIEQALLTGSGTRPNATPTRCSRE